MADDTVLIPPIRTNLNDPNVTAQTAKEWYLYWKQSGDRINVLNRMVAAGTHGDRPGPGDVPEGALYYENDRGVLYAATLGVWQYVAGTMWGTLSPDERPTDLGTHDAGFTFRTSVAPPREFIWSQTAWVEVTPESNTLQLAAGTTTLTLTTATQNVPGCSLTLARNGTYLVTGTFDFSHNGDGGQVLIGGLSASTASSALFQTLATSGSRGTFAQQWMITASAGAVINLTAFKTGGAGTSATGGSHTTIAALWVSP